jgi:F-type H+-transporting ATPase subunit b
VQRQRVALASELKTVLDSWVRFEQQEKEKEQNRLVKSVVDSVLKSISEDKTQKDVLAWAVTEVDREFFVLPSLFSNLLTMDTELVKNKAI